MFGRRVWQGLDRLIFLFPEMGVLFPLIRMLVGHGIKQFLECVDFLFSLFDQLVNQLFVLVPLVHKGWHIFLRTKGTANKTNRKKFNL